MKRIILVISVLLPLAAFAQQTALPVADNISTGVLPNGISYYVVSNNQARGYADFALIQQGMSFDPSTREVLTRLPEFSKTEPYRYLASKGVGYREEGYIQNMEEAAVYRFDDVPVFNQFVSDSTLLLLFDIMKNSPREQALVVSGDIDRGRIIQQIQMLALSVPARTALADLPVYRWEPSDSLKVTHRPNGSLDLAEIRITYNSRRSPRETLNTTRSFLSRMYASQLGEIVSGRVIRNFALRGIPAAGLSGYYLESSRTGGDEKYSMVMYTSYSRLDEAISLLSGILADMDVNGVTLRELEASKRIVRSRMLREMDKVFFTNREYVDRCVESYLYGASLAPSSAALDYFRRRDMDPEQELSIFNRFCSALLSPKFNITVDLKTPSSDYDVARAGRMFTDSWKPSKGQYAPAADDFVLPDFPEKKVRLKNSLPDPVTGGEIWSFSNGMKVIYRQTQEKDMFRYSLMLRGGVSDIPGLAGGERAYVNDILGGFSIAGLPAGRFGGYLSSEGITMTSEVTATDLRIGGTAPVDKMGELVRALYHFGYSRTIDGDFFNYYRKCCYVEAEREKASSAGLEQLLEELACPDYLYSEYRTIAGITPDLPYRTESFLESLFSKCDDGVLILAGGMQKEKVKEMLCRSLGAFETGMRHSSRKRISYPLKNGWYTRTVSGEECSEWQKGLHISIKAFHSFSAKSMMSLQLACEALETALEKELCDNGYHVEVEGNLDLFPDEMLSVRIRCLPCAVQGLPSGVVPSSQTRVLLSARPVLARMSDISVNAEELQTYKSSLRSRMATKMNDPDFIVEASLVRNAEGKDIVSGYDALINSIQAGDIAEILKALDNGIKAEVMVK